MDKYKISPEAKKTLDQFKVEAAKELTGDMRRKNIKERKQQYDLRANLTDSTAVTEQLLEVDEKSRKNPNNSFSDFLGKYF
ncbi:small, acid-soluble spore protein, alpha/beta type [Alkaliphilus hydrothermalis]|uniref:Uncharacterized protein n=1 Tax=Alkaliphilus hydrothermalis TaxID=1482730 RepID=A0ABS2NPR2_9FIRM|nr:small, acid-soluble spore protein, alpha/beta type [Alkaliphilus hydrothermalis]MBM7614928.1 hypothetical protein [Alkaliphilus hydrothermalis]